MTNNDLQNITQKTKDRVTRTSLKTFTQQLLYTLNDLETFIYSLFLYNQMYVNATFDLDIGLKD